MSSEYQKWEAITKSSPSSGRASVADIQKWLDVGGVQARPSGAPSDDLLKRRIVERAMDILAKAMPEAMTPINPHPPTFQTFGGPDASFAGIQPVQSLRELARLQSRRQLETPRSEWRPIVTKNERRTDEQRRQDALDAARRDDPLSQVGQPVH